MSAFAVIPPEELEALIERAVAKALAARPAAPAELEAVTMKEAAKRLGVAYKTVQRRVRDGSLPSVRVGNAVRVRLDAIPRDDVQIARLALAARRP